MYIASMYIGFFIFRDIWGTKWRRIWLFYKTPSAYAPGAAVVGVLLRPHNKIYQYV